MTDLSAYFRGLARHHAWATQRLCDALEPLSDTDWHRDAGLFFGSVHRTVNHLLLTDQGWFLRIARGESFQLALDTQLHAERAPLIAAWRSAVPCWQPWLADLDEARLSQQLQYTRANGQTVSIPFAQALGHQFNHATHHRGQVSAAITAFGHPAPVMDWVYQMQQEQIGAPAP